MNQTYRQIYDSLVQEKNALNEQSKSLQTKQFEVDDKIGALIEAVVLEEKLLSKGTWIIEPKHYGPSHFSLTCMSRSGEMKELSKIAETNYHCRCSLGGVDLRFDDGRISLSFDEKSPITALEFVRKHEMKLNYKPVLEELDDAKKKLKELEEIIGAFTP